ncbi:HAD family hydrolase [Propionispira raffinosivorans]|uniref:HAD family hydrolase n=1 Tax=Propionispira raffinosivorans TaxID=86959 RepID=UPI000370FAFC|nr:hypothetical protein [Propionispira raffinosivorans]
MFYSFDVFDTLITRTTATPRGIFTLMQQRLQEKSFSEQLSQYIRENFYALRIHSEELARMHYQRNRVEEVTLEQIYEALGTVGNLPMAVLESLAILERHTEIDQVIGVTKNIDRVRSLVEQGERVVLIVDAYMDAATIRQMLRKAEAFLSEIPLYVSSEYKKRKSSGILYKVVQECENVEFYNWQHVGNNLQSDVEQPRQLGIRAERFSYEAFLPIEADRLNAHEQDMFTQLLIGVSRNERLHEQWCEAAAIGCTAAAPILFPYVQWMLEEAKRRGIRRLYFIARDGYILQKIATILITKWQLPITTHYIYGSRRAWRMPSYENELGSLRRLIGWMYPIRITTMEKLAETLQVTVDELKRFLPKEYHHPKRQISYAALCICIMLLEKQFEFRRWFFERQRPTRLLVQRYLQQEVDTSDDDFAFVDLGGGGLTQSCLAKLMQDFYDGPVRTFFFKMDKINLMKNCIYYNFLPSKLKNELVIEMICRASHGQTEGYKIENDKVVPLLKAGEGEAIIEHGYDDYTKGIEGFVKAYASIVERYHVSVQIDLLLQYMEYIMHHPDQKLLDFFADMPNSVTGREKKVLGFAPKLTKQNIRDIYLWHPNEAVDQYYKGTDLEFSRLRCNVFEIRKIEFYQKKRLDVIQRYERFTHTIVPQSPSFSLQTQGLPYSLFGERIVLYGAGKYGREIYYYMKQANVSVVQWLDQNYSRFIKQGQPVTGDICALGEVTYDAILIAILDTQLAMQARENILSMGIPDEKIICLGKVVEYLNI